MKAVILAAGKGSRLGAITSETPKPLLPVNGKPVLRHLVELCARHGIGEVFINTHYLAARIRSALGDGSEFGVCITYSYEDELLGTAGALSAFRDALTGDAFLVIYGDNFMDYDLAELLRFHHKKGGIATVALYELEDVSHSGIAVLDDEQRILRFIEKPRPEEAVSNLVNCGLYVLSPEILDDIPEGFSDFGRDIFPALLQQNRKLYGYVMDHALIPIDTVEMYNKAQRESDLLTL